MFDTIEEDGAVTVGNPCLSGGAIEVFLEPTAAAVLVVEAERSLLPPCLTRS